VHLHEADNVAVAVDGLDSGAEWNNVRLPRRVPRGHKLAIQPIAAGEPVRKFGQIIGFATSPIGIGGGGHGRNVAIRDFTRGYEFAEEAGAEVPLPAAEHAVFQGYRRENGKAGTRNYISILTSVNCSASAARFIAEEVSRSGILADYPNVDGV